MSMANLRAEPSAFPASPAAPRTAAHALSKRARHLKLELSTRLVSTREVHRIKQRDVHDRQQLVSEWENPLRPHSPTLMNLAEQVSDPVSRPYALEAIAWVLEKAEREESDPRQLSLLDLIAANQD
jgi:hypothetical protein